MNHLTQEIEAAWLLRFDQKIPEFRACVLKLGNLAESRRERSGAEPADEVELLLLRSSLLRAEGKLDASRALLVDAEQLAKEARVEPRFHFSFQRAIAAWIENDYSRALELFMVARARAASGHEEIFATINVLLCLENLGVSTERVHAELREQLRRNPGTLQLSRVVATQLEAFELRQAFRNGRIAEIARTPIELPPPGKPDVSQALYYRLWLTELPYLAADLGVRGAEYERFYLSSPFAWQKSYRFRTLQGISHPDDLASPLCTELCDRIYLWTWRWLCRPESFPLSQAVEALSGILAPATGQRLTREDFQQLRCSLLWLGLFDSRAKGSIERLLAALRPAGSAELPVFGLEHRLLRYLYELRDGTAASIEAAGQALRQHPLYDCRELRFASIARSLGERAGVEGVREAESTDGELSALTERLSTILNREQECEATLRLNLSDFELSWDGGKQRLVSRPVCLLLEELRRTGSLGFGDALRTCYGITRFDPIVHSGKVYSLLSRAKACLPPELQLSTKDGRIYARGSWEGVAMIRTLDVAESLRANEAWLAILGSRLAAPRTATKKPETSRGVIPPQLLIRAFAGNAELKRAELESMLGMSRASALRQINRWVDSGALRKHGNARQTTYQLAPRPQGNRK